MSKTRETQSLLTHHPDREYFSRFGSPLNFLSSPEGRSLSSSYHIHYGGSQSVFANHSMKKLIELVRGFDYKYIIESFENNSLKVQDFFEGIYKKITDDRYDLALNTKSSYFETKKIELYAGIFPDEQLLEEENNWLEDQEYNQEDDNIRDILDLLEYRFTYDQEATSTNLSQSQDGRYLKYENYIKNCGQNIPKLLLSHLVEILGEEIREDDNNISLGDFSISQDGWVIHNMGNYRENNNYEKINRVDEITALAATKALTTEDEDEAMRYALVFGIMRGYNIRSAVGACWAQEMSLRWIFAMREWEQFKKAPGIYLDIEALNISAGNERLELEALIEKELHDYKESVQGRTEAGNIFDVPLPATEESFLLYLMEARAYRSEDIEEIVTIFPKSLEIAARGGDRFFFENLQTLMNESQNDDFCKKINEIDWNEIIFNASEYGDEFLVSQIENIQSPSSIISKRIGSEDNLEKENGKSYKR